MHPEPHTDLDNLNTVQHNLRNSAKGSNDAYDVTVSSQFVAGWVRVGTMEPRHAMHFRNVFFSPKKQILKNTRLQQRAFFGRFIGCFI